jgi:hypothetical protein
MSDKDTIYADINVQKALDLSTSHIPEPGSGESPDFGVRNSQHFWGWVVFVAPGLDEDAIPEWFRPAYRKAVSLECVVILYDADGPVDPDLPAYDW